MLYVVEGHIILREVEQEGVEASSSILGHFVEACIEVSGYCESLLHRAPRPIFIQVGGHEVRLDGAIWGIVSMLSSEWVVSGELNPSGTKLFSFLGLCALTVVTTCVWSGNRDTKHVEIHHSCYSVGHIFPIPMRLS
jgi:hypothetical protein